MANTISDEMQETPASLPQLKEQFRSALLRLMARCGAKANAPDFLAAVNAAYMSTKKSVPSRHAFSHQVFRRGFCQLLNHAEHPLDFVVLGCDGNALAGQGFDYAKEVLLAEVRSNLISTIQCKNLSIHPDVEPLSQADVVVLHSVAHFSPFLEPFFDAIVSLVRPQGYLLLAHEPHSRFWKNAECIGAMRARRAKRLGMIRSAARKLGNAIGWKQDQNEFAINAQLRQSIGLKGRLSMAEINRIVDPHRRGLATPILDIGLDGFSAEQLSADYLGQFDLLWQESYGHIGFDGADVVDPTYRDVNCRLCSMYPNDGANFSTLWRRNG